MNFRHKNKLPQQTGDRPETAQVHETVYSPPETGGQFVPPAPAADLLLRETADTPPDLRVAARYRAPAVRHAAEFR